MSKAHTLVRFLLACFLLKSQELEVMVALPDLLMFFTIGRSSVFIKGGLASIEAVSMTKHAEAATALVTASI